MQKCAVYTYYLFINKASIVFFLLSIQFLITSHIVGFVVFVLVIKTCPVKSMMRSSVGDIFLFFCHFVVVKFLQLSVHFIWNPITFGLCIHSIMMHCAVCCVRGVLYVMRYAMESFSVLCSFANISRQSQYMCNV